VGNGIADDTEAIQAAINENDAIYIPEGDYNIDYLSIPSNKNILGTPTSKLIQYLETGHGLPTGYLRSLLEIQADTEGTFIENIVIDNLTLDGKVEVFGFNEGAYLTLVAGGKNINLNNIRFIGFRGDGVIMTAGVNPNWPYPGTEIPLHNVNTTITNCLFDGVNNDNRNGISIIDNDGLLVENCQFINTTRSNMPGAIDFEPDREWSIVSNSIIRDCTFENIGGGGAILMISPGILSTVPNNFTIENNIIQNCPLDSGSSLKGAILYTTDFSNTNVSNVLIRGNTIKDLDSPGVITSGNGITFENNIYTNCTNNLDIHAVDNLVFSGNNISNCGTTGSAVTFFTMNTTDINTNTFTNCGNIDGSGNAIFILNGTMVNTKINYNTFSSPSSITNKAIAVQEGVIFTGYQQFIGNNLNGLPSDYPSIP
jgi:hypothetical protein